MRITFDEAKRSRTLAERDLDFRQAINLFSGTEFSFIDDRKEYGEVRMLTVGRLEGRLTAVVWTPRGDARHIISMRKCNLREEKKYGWRVDRS